MDNREKLRQIIAIKGPVVPSDVYSEIGSNILMTSAFMAEMVSNKILKISSLKIGSSPLYYLSGQEEKLQNFSKYLHEKEKKAYELLKEKKVLKDSVIEPVIRVALREIKDFAVPLKVNYKDKSEVFWKWYLLPKEDAEKTIKKEIGIKDIKEEDVKSVKEEERQKELKTHIKKEPLKTQPKKTTPVFDKIYDYFNKNKISIISKEINKKGSGGDLIIEVPSPVGNIKYFCRVKGKKKINDSDLASAFVQGQQNKLPVLYVTSGQLTKKAKEMLNKEFKGMNLKQI